MIGLELSLIYAIELQSNTDYAIDAKQILDTESETRVDFYARQVAELSASLKDQNISHLVADAYYSKVKFIDTICSNHLNMVGKLRIDADLQWYFEGKYKGIGRPKTYDGKVHFQSI